MKRVLGLAAALLCGFGIAHAQAPDEETIGNVHCLLITSAITMVDDADVRNAGQIATMYWWGRLDGQAPGADLEALVTAEAPKLTGDLLKSERQRCGAILQDRGQALVSLGQALQAQGDKQAVPAPDQPKQQ